MAAAAAAVPSLSARSSLATPPKEFGKNSYVLRDELGHGASGRVFECKKKNSSMLYAVKTLHLRSLRLRKTAERDLTRLGRELKILKELPPHPRIVQMVDSFEEGDWFFMVLELVRGGDLGRALRERRPSRLLENETEFVFWQLVEGIGFLHGRNIIHRDLKLENVLISDRHREGKAIKYNVKISDFGLSKAISSVPEVHSVVGTQRYVAPEVLTARDAGNAARPGAYDFRVDLWSLGVLTFLLLTGGYPNNQSQQVLDDAVNQISSESARLMIKGLLQLDPEERFTLQDVQARSWQTGDEDVIMLPAATGNHMANGAVMVASDSSPCSDYDWLARCPPAPLHSVNDPSLLSGIPLEPEPEPGRVFDMSFLEGMEEEIRRPFEKAPSPRAPVVSQEQMSSSSWQRSARTAVDAEVHLHVLVPKRADSTCLVDEERLKELSTSSGCNVWTLPPEGPNDAYHVVTVGSCSQCTVAQQMLADFYRQEGGQKSFTVIMFLPSEVHLNERELDDLHQRSHCTVELLQKEQEGKRPWIITGTLVQVLEAQRLLYTGHKRRKVTQSPGGAST